MRTYSILAMCFLTITLAVPCAAEPTAKQALDPKHFDDLQRLIKPGAEEVRWAQVAWMPSTDIWAARQKAAREGKPLFLWYMAGEPLGTC